MSLFLKQVKELLERHLGSNEIAHRLHCDLCNVESAVAILTKRSTA